VNLKKRWEMEIDESPGGIIFPQLLNKFEQAKSPLKLSLDIPENVEDYDDIGLTSNNFTVTTHSIVLFLTNDYDDHFYPVMSIGIEKCHF
jgi:hypothetical protein